MRLPEAGCRHVPFAAADALDRPPRAFDHLLGAGRTGRRAAGCRSPPPRAATARAGHGRRCDLDHVPRPVRIEDHLDLGTRSPHPFRQPLVGPGLDLRAGQVGLDLVAAVAPVPRSARGVDRQAHPGAPPGAVERTTRQLLDEHVPLDPAETAQLLRDHRGPEGPLGRHRRVGQVAASRSAGPGDRAHPLPPVRRGLENVHGVGAAERAASVLRHRRDDPLAG